MNKLRYLEIINMIDDDLVKKAEINEINAAPENALKNAGQSDEENITLTGVDVYRARGRHRFAAAAASVILLAGLGAAGALFAFSGNKKPDDKKQEPPTFTVAAPVTTRNSAELSTAASENSITSSTAVSVRTTAASTSADEEITTSFEEQKPETTTQTTVQTDTATEFTTSSTAFSETTTAPDTTSEENITSVTTTEPSLDNYPVIDDEKRQRAAAADLDGDGRVTMNDALELMKYILKTMYFNEEDIPPEYRRYEELGDIDGKDGAAIIDASWLMIYVKEITPAGDVNEDGIISATDASYLLKFIADYSDSTCKDNLLNARCHELGDMNGDQKLNAVDASLILVKYAELSTDSI